ncbi:ig domain protein group 2 domain protein [Vibrio sp. RC586]|uniref:Lcl domain-containing protein n=1 Tax=Vibrio sp. RC586 TaxID=675815 RepID=UPI0001BB8404|nr:DUF1566 domain-containing protein [Vibrio sp. RC586]EEY98220.1 ig domain protein group 2 domain protein [Vibrio sp. RC586]
MKKYLKPLFTLVLIPLAILLAGCNSEGAFTRGEIHKPQVTATLIEITVTPTPVLMLKGRTQQLVAIAKYDDGTEVDVSNSVIWEIVGDPTTTQLSPIGLLTALNAGTTELMAAKDGISSNLVNVIVCDNLAAQCIDTIDAGNGKLFTSSPSVTYLDSIGGSATDGQYSGDEISSPLGSFYTFNLASAHALCATYNTQNLAGRSNWRLASRDELKTELYDMYGNMFNRLGWPNHFQYWSETTPDPGIPANYAVSLTYGNIMRVDTSLVRSVSCVSNP